MTIETVTSAAVLTPLEKTSLTEAVHQFAVENGISLTVMTLEALKGLPDGSPTVSGRVVAICGDEDAAELFNLAKTGDFSLGIIPNEKSRLLKDWFKLPATLPESLALAFGAKTAPVDVLTCNGEVVLGQLMLGKLPFLDRSSRTYLNRHSSLWDRWKYRWSVLRCSLRNLREIRPFPVTLTTGKERVLKTVITGLVTIENEVNSPATRLLYTSVSVQDHKMSTILVAPKSVVEYLGFLSAALFKGDHSVKRLPGAVSYLKTSSLVIEAGQPITYYADGRRRESATLALTVHRMAIQVAVGEAYLAQQGGTEEEKDTVRIENLPEQQDRVAMIRRRLPFFTRAMEDDFKGLFLSLKDVAAIKTEYVVLTMLSSVLACLGMFLDSTAVIIGAMVLAPLMAPIIALAMGLLRGNQALINTPLITTGFGVGLALAVAAFMAMVIPSGRITVEIAARMQPNLLDLGVAIASGIAGAYAYARESVAKSLPGVAIAVALVPPLCVTGIGIGWFDLEMITGAFLLFLTNLIGIALAAAVTFFMLGYAPVVKSRRGLIISLGLLVAITIPLSISFQNMHHTWQLEKGLASETYTLNGQAIKIKEARIRIYRGKILLRAESVGSHTLSLEDLSILKSKLEEKWGRPVVLDIDSRLTL